MVGAGHADMDDAVGRHGLNDIGAFRAAVRAELRRLFRRPWDDLVVVGINALIVCVGWVLLPAGAKKWLFTLTGPMAFAVVLETWMLADTHATNMLGNDAATALTVCRDPVRLRRLLRAKAVALACVIAPACAIVAAVIGAVDRRFAAGALLAGLLLVLPFGVLVVTPWLGVRWPYHPRPLPWRWERRRPYRRTLRWITLVFAPYGVVPVILLALLGPAVAIAAATADRQPSGALTTAAVATATGLAGVVTALVFAVGPHLSARLARARGPLLTGYLKDTDRG